MTNRATARLTLAADIERYASGKSLTKDEYGAPCLEQWSCEIRHRGRDYFMVCCGEVQNHSKAKDGTRIRTPPIVWFDRKEGWVRTIDRFFNLGAPHGEKYPGEDDDDLPIKGLGID